MSGLGIRGADGTQGTDGAGRGLFWGHSSKIGVLRGGGVKFGLRAAVWTVEWGLNFFNRRKRRFLRFSLNQLI